MHETPFQTVRRDDLNPVCPHCQKTLSEVYYKGRGAGWFLFARDTIFFCPHCRKVLGLAQSRMA